MFCIGVIPCYVSESAVSFLRPGQQYLTREYKKAICDLSTFNSYRTACAEFDKRYNRKANESLKRSTFSKHLSICGAELIARKDREAAEILEFYGFDPETLEYVKGEFPEELRTKTAEKVTLSETSDIKEFPSDDWNPDDPDRKIPEEYLYRHTKASKADDAGTKFSDEGTDVISLEDEEAAEDEASGENLKKDSSARDSAEGVQQKQFSKPDEDTTPYSKKRRVRSPETPPEEKLARMDSYRAWRNEHLKNPISRILYRWSQEKDSREVVYI